MIHTRVDMEEAIIYQECQGEVHLFDVLAVMISPLESEVDPTTPVLWNLQRSEILATPNELNKVPSDVVNLANEMRPLGKTAWVMQSARGEATINLLYEQYSWKAPWQTFVTLESAIAWCKNETSDRAPRRA